MITHLEPDILECKVKWALDSVIKNKASGGDGIPVELFQILKDDTVKVLHSICQHIWKTQQWPQDWKRSVFIPIPKKSNVKECSNYCTIALISHTSKVMLKILQARLQQYMNRELPDVQAGFRKGIGTRDQIVNIRWIMEKAREFQKNIYFCFIDCAKAFDCVDHNKLWKIPKEMGIPDHLTCLLRNLYAGQEATVRTGHGTIDWFQIGKRVCQGCILSLIIREKQIKCTIRYHLTPVRVAIIKSLQTLSVGKQVEKREPFYTVGGNVSWYSHYREQCGGSLRNYTRTHV